MAWYNPFGRADVGDSQAQKNTPQAQAQPVASTSTSTPESAPASKWRLRSATTSPLSLSRDSPSQSTPPPPQSTPSPIATSPELFQHAPPSPQYVSPTTFLTSLSPILPLSAFGIGFVSGLFSSAERASLVFLAENAHRKPTTVQGWYFYNKTKNYRVVWAAAKGAMKSGCRLGVWSSLFTVIEGASLFSRTVGFKEHAPTDSHTDTRTIDEPPAEYTAAYRLGHWTDGMVAGQGVALAAIAVYRTSPFRFLGLGTIAGTLTGLLQDIRDELVWREKRKEMAEARHGGGAPEQATRTSAQ